MNISFLRAVEVLANPPQKIEVTRVNEWLLYFASLPLEKAQEILKNQSENIYDFSGILSDSINTIYDSMSVLKKNSNMALLHKTILKNKQHFFNHYEVSTSVPMCVYMGVRRVGHPSGTWSFHQSSGLSSKIMELSNSLCDRAQAISLFHTLSKENQLEVIGHLAYYKSFLADAFCKELSNKKQLFVSDIVSLQDLIDSRYITLVVREQDIPLLAKETTIFTHCHTFNLELENMNLLPLVEVNEKTDLMISGVINKIKEESILVNMYRLARAGNAKRTFNILESRLKCIQNHELLKTVWPWLTRLENNHPLTKEDLKDKSVIVDFIKKIYPDITHSLNVLDLPVNRNAILEHYASQAHTASEINVML